VGLLKNLGVVIPPERVGDKQAAEEQDFRHEENPDSQLARVKLLLGIVEVVGNEFTMIMVMIVMMCGIRHSHDRLPR
jgi:hypothetical protein